MPIVTLYGFDLIETVDDLKMYSDGTPMVKIPGWAKIVQRTHTMVLRPKTLNDFVVGMFLVDAINMAGGKVWNLILPYVPGARQDRTNPSGDVLFTAFSVADMLNVRDFDKVVILDPHSDVIRKQIDRVVVYPMAEVATKLWGGYGGIIAPDAGATERAEDVAFVLDLPIVYGSKVRDVSTGALSGFDVSVEAGTHYLVVDDICDGGGTFIGLGEKIKEQGAFADLFVTHGIFSKGTNSLRKIYKNIYTTDSRDIHAENVFIIGVLDEMRNYG